MKEHTIWSVLRQGHQIDAPVASGGMHSERDARGLVAAETYSQDATQTRRDYSYDGRGVLTRSESSGDIASYSFRASGLPDSIRPTVTI